MAPFGDVTTTRRTRKYLAGGVAAVAVPGLSAWGVGTANAARSDISRAYRIGVYDASGAHLGDANLCLYWAGSAKTNNGYEGRAVGGGSGGTTIHLEPGSYTYWMPAAPAADPVRWGTWRGPAGSGTVKYAPLGTDETTNAGCP